MSAALDTRPPDTLLTSQQDVGQPRFAPTPSGCRWFVLATMANAERRAHAALHLKGFRPYLPTITVRTAKRQYRTTALFPGYLFVCLDPGKPWYPIRYAPGVFSLLTIDGIPIPCPQGAVEAIQAAESERALYPPAKQLWSPGAPCALNSGPFQGCDAVILKVGRDMATVALLMFGELREVAVQLDCLSGRED